MSLLYDFMEVVLKQDGKPYVWGSDGPDSFDCSGLIVYGLQQTKIIGPRQDFGSAALFDMGEEIPLEEGYQTRGAFLYMQGHIAISMGDGKTAFEARNPTLGVGHFPVNNRGFTRASILKQFQEGDNTMAKWSGRMASPVKGRVSCEWRGYRNHAGIDIACPVGTPVYAAFAGTVVKAGWNILRGRTGFGILVRNPDRELQYYGHLSRIMVRNGQKVRMGQLIGLSGRTGRVTGPHLHFETQYPNGRDFNPRIRFNGHGVVPGSTKGQNYKTKTRSFLPLAIDGSEGHKTITEEQRALKLTREYRGIIEEDHGKRAVRGSWLNHAWQRFLRRKGFYKYAIDGRFGYRSIVAEQKWLHSVGCYNRKIDGKRGKETIKGVQRALNKKLVK